MDITKKTKIVVSGNSDDIKTNAEDDQEVHIDEDIDIDIHLHRHIDNNQHSLRDVLSDRTFWSKGLAVGVSVGAALGFIMPALFQADVLQASSLLLAPQWTSALVSIGAIAGVTVLSSLIWARASVEKVNAEEVVETTYAYKDGVEAYNAAELGEAKTAMNAAKVNHELTHQDIKDAEAGFRRLNQPNRILIAALVAIAANVIVNLLLAYLSLNTSFDITYAGSLHSTMSMSIFAAGFAALAGISAYALQDDEMRKKFGASIAVGGVVAIVGSILSSTIASNLGFSLATTGLTHEMSSMLIGCAFGGAAAAITALAQIIFHNKDDIEQFATTKATEFSTKVGEATTSIGNFATSLKDKCKNLVSGSRS